MNGSSTWVGAVSAPTSIGVGTIQIDGFSEQKMSFALRTNQAGAAIPVPTARATRVHEGSALTKAALDLLGAADRSGAAVARRVLGKFAAAADAFDVANAPDLHLVEEDDGAILIEWAFADRRLGFSIEQQPEDSGWYFVLSNDSSERYEAGRLDQLKMRRLVKIMLTEQGGSGPPAVAPLEGQIDRLFDEIRDLVVRSAENPASKSEIERKREELRALQEKEAAAWRRDRVARAHLKPGEGYRLLELAANLLDS